MTFRNSHMHINRINKVAGTMEQLMGGDEIYHYHSKVRQEKQLFPFHFVQFVTVLIKLIMKQPKTGGEFVWHQDYGYWYNNGCMLPEMGSIFMPVDR